MYVGCDLVLVVWCGIGGVWCVGYVGGDVGGGCSGCYWCGGFVEGV